MRSGKLTLLAMVILAAAAPRALGANDWTEIARDRTGQRAGAVLVPAAGKLLYFGGDLVGKVPYMQAFDLAGGSWSDFSSAKPPARRGIHVYYQTVCDAKAGVLYCLSSGRLYTFDLAKGKWNDRGPVAALAGLSWHAAAIDQEARKLVVVGADKRPGNLGWTRTIVCDLASGKWSELPPPDEEARTRRRQLVAGVEAIGELIGRTRLAWYRDPKGVGTDAEIKDLAQRCRALKELAGMSRFAAAAEKVAALLAEPKTLGALKAARALQREVEQLAERQYPVPPSRRNSPLAFDATNKLFVLFGGDHEDYLTNDTWLLDLSRGAWRRARPKLAPSPRAGHALVHLPGTGKVALYAGYVQSNDNWYGTRPWKPAQPQELWTYDAKADRWDLLGAWQAKRGAAAIPAPGLGFYGYSGQYYSPPALATDGKGGLILEVPGTSRSKSATWTLKVDAARHDAAGAKKLGKAPDQRLYRTERFLASYCEVPDAPKPTGLDKLPANKWVALPPVRRNAAYGCRQRDWGTAVWDSDNDQIILWGGGHCVRSASCPLHYSPISGRMVEGYDADEPYSANGGGGSGSSLVNRPWVDAHAYNAYAYDPKAKLMVTSSGFLYDPLRMDWLRDGPMRRPFRFTWSSTVMEATPHGAVVWTRAAKESRVGLWVFDRPKGWTDLKPRGKLRQPYCDSEGMTYDSKRDRLLLGWGGGYMKAGDGTLTAFDFKSRDVEKVTPGNLELGRIQNTREMMYADHADWVLFAEPLVVGKGKAAKPYLRIYDCEKNKYFLLDAGRGPQAPTHSQGWCYDAGRKLIYVITFRGAVHALRIDPSSAELREKP